MIDTEPRASLGDAVAWLAACDALPAEVDAKARLLLLDTLGCLIAGLQHEDVLRFGQSLRPGFPGPLSWPSSDTALGPAGLAALGATAACWDEACEGNAAAHGRPGLPVVPAVLALAADRDATLGDALIAIATGYEIGARAGEAWRIPPGWHVDGGWHSLGVAAAAARLLGGPERMQAAIETAACQIPASLYLPITAGSVVRNTYVAHAVLLGVMAAAAAHADFEPPRGALEEARRRVLRASDDAAPSPAGRWTLLDGYLKPFASVRHTHYAVAAALKLRARTGFALDKIRGVTLRTYGEAVQYCGNRTPATPIQAQFSLSYAIAAALVLGDLGPEAYADVGDATIVGIERRVAIEAESQRTRRGAALVIDLGDETLTESVDAVAGDATMPMRRDDVLAKFTRYTAPALGRAQAETLAAFCLDGGAQEPARRCFTFAPQR
ncbi:MAG: MmgE/PrpD family protein [Pseudolabrys sp.]